MKNLIYKIKSRKGLKRLIDVFLGLYIGSIILLVLSLIVGVGHLAISLLNEQFRIYGWDRSLYYLSAMVVGIVLIGTIVTGVVGIYLNYTESLKRWREFTTEKRSVQK